jgi:anti-sigma regulatory factor (Ser/Thr protein kinase)
VPEGDGWQPAWWLSSTSEVAPLVEFVAGAMAARGYPPKDLFGMRLALEEAPVNAIKHGHRNDPAKKVQVRYSVGARTTPWWKWRTRGRGSTRWPCRTRPQRRTWGGPAGGACC